MPDDTLLSEASGSLLHSQFSGHGCPKKSKNLQGLTTSNPDPIRQLKNFRLKWAIRDAAKLKAQERRHRSRFNKLHEWLVTHSAGPCQRRACESAGLTTKNFEYTVKPKFVIPNPKFIFELNNGFEPIATFTDCGEAIASCVSMNNFGFPAAFVVSKDRSRA